MHFTSLATLILLAVGGAVAGPIGVILALPAAALLRDVSFYTSYRAGGLSPAAALGRLPLFQREQARRASADGKIALPSS
jgi:hypothetical protein